MYSIAGYMCGARLLSVWVPWLLDNSMPHSTKIRFHHEREATTFCGIDNRVAFLAVDIGILLIDNHCLLRYAQKYHLLAFQH